LAGKPKAPEYVELSFTTIETPLVSEEEPSAVEPETEKNVSKAIALKSKSSAANQEKSVSSNLKGANSSDSKSSNVKTGAPKISPPRYNLAFDDNSQPTRFPDSKLSASDSRNYTEHAERSGSSTGYDKGNFSGNVNSDKISAGSGSASSGVSSPGSSNVGKEIKGYSIAWRDGGNRGKISGAMPRYPENTNKEVQIKVKVTVSPDGIISQVVPLQKADYTFENAVTTALRTWKFEKLKPGQPQESQTGIITFNFKLN